MKKFVTILVAAVIVLAWSLAYAETMTRPSEFLYNGITYFEPMSDCDHAEGIAAGGAAGPIVEVRISNGVTYFEPVQHIYGMGSCVNTLAEAAPAPVMPNNGITYFELK